MVDLPDSDQPTEKPLSEEAQPKVDRPLEEVTPEETEVSEETPSQPTEETPPGEPKSEEILPSTEEASSSPPTEGGPPTLPTEEPTPPPEEEKPEEPVKVSPSVPPPTETPEEVSAPEVEPPVEEPEEETPPSPPEEVPSPPPEEPAPPPPPTEPPEIVRIERRSPFELVKKILPLILVILIVLGLAWAFFRFRPSFPQIGKLGKPGEVTLTYWGLWEPNSVMGEILTNWERKNPGIKISYTQQSPKEYRERLQSALARGEGPDVFRFHHTWLPMLKDELEPVPASVMDAGTYGRTFYPVAATTLRSGANYMGIPLEIDTLALFYNQDIFTAAGESPPRTWDELRKLASKLTLRDEDGRIRRAGVALGTTSNIWHWSDILGLMMLQNGADLTNPTGSLAEDALTFYTLFNRTERVWDDTLPVSIMAFATGKTAMFFGYSWDVFEIKNINPDLNFKIVPAPQLPGTDIAWASFWVEGVSKKSKNKEAAWEFLKYLSSKEVMQELYQAESKVRFFGEPYSRVEMASLIQTDPMVAAFINQAPKAETWYLCSRTFDNGINDRMIKYFEDAVNAVNDGQDPGRALTTAASGVAQVLSQYGLGAYTVR